MEKVIRWFVNNSVASNLMMFFIILSGIATIPLLKMEVFPDIEVDIINVTAVYPGATPSDVENAVCIRIEERLQALDEEVFRAHAKYLLHQDLAYSLSLIHI